MNTFGYNFTTFNHISIPAFIELCTKTNKVIMKINDGIKGKYWQ